MVSGASPVDIRAVRRLFPDHKSTAEHAFLVSFAGLGFLSFYLAGKLHLFDEKGHTV